jgi:hypothetical protein
MHFTYRRSPEPRFDHGHKSIQHHVANETDGKRLYER